MQGFVNTIRTQARTGAPVLLVLLGFSIPVSVVSDNILLGLILLCWILGGSYAEKWRLMWRNPVARAGLILFLLLVLGSFHGPGRVADALNMLFKLKVFLLIGLFVGLIPDEPRLKTRMLNAFLWAMGLTLVLTFLIAFGLLHPEILHLHGQPGEPEPFKDHITQNFLMSFAVFVWLLRAVQSKGMPRLGWVALALPAIYSIVFLVPGRTGYLTLALLALYAAFLFAHAKSWGLWGGLILIVMAGLAAFHYSHRFEHGIMLARSQVLKWERNPVANQYDSIGLRLDFYENSLQIWKEHPLSGVGTGSFMAAYQGKVAGTGQVATDNPHNDYLLIAVQLGAVGLVALFYLYLCSWRASQELGDRERNLARGLVILYMSGGMVDAVLLSHTESLCFAWFSALFFSSLPGVWKKT